MKTKLLRKHLPLLLVLLMVFSLLPTAAFAGGEDVGDPPNQPDTVNVDVIVAKLGYDGWEILYPEAVNGSTELAISGSEDAPNLYDLMMNIDPQVILRSNGNIDTLFGLKSSNDGVWFGTIGGAVKTKPKEAPLTDGDKVAFYYYDGMSPRPDWDELVELISNPNPVHTPKERWENLLAAELNFDKIKGKNSSADNITTDLGSLPDYLDGSYSFNANFIIKWTSSDITYISHAGKLLSRPPSGSEPISVTMTATITAGSGYNPDKYGSREDLKLPKTVEIELKIAPLTGEEEEDNKSSVQDALAEINLENFKLMDGETLDPNNVLYDISLVDPREYGDKTTVYLPDGYWSSDDPNVISVNWLRAKVTRPALGQPDATVKLTVTAAKGGYAESKEFTVTVKAVTQAELDAVNAELDAVETALTFDVIKEGNISADAVTSSLQTVYRGLGYPGTISWETKNSGDKGVKIEWETSDAGTVTSYGTVKRPSTEDKHVTMTATLTPFRLADYVQSRTVEIPMIVRKISNAADVAAISMSPSLGFTFDAATKSYDLTAPAIVDSVAITVTTEETGTLITSGQHSACGTLSFDVALNADQTTAVTIDTKALDSENTDTYTINITREAADVTDTAVLELLAAIAGSYKNTFDDWAAIDMVAYGLADDVAGADILKNARNVYADYNTTDIARSVITLTSLGVDASNVYSGNENIYLDFIEKLGEKAPAQIIEAVFGLIALDSGEYDDDGLTLTRQSCIDFLLDKKMAPKSEQFAWIIWGDSPDVDTTAMAVTALAPYYNSNADVKTVIDGALKYLSVQQNNYGHYGNSNSTSMVIVALTALGKDPNVNSGDFAKNGKSLIDGLLAFRTSSDRLGFDNNTTESAMSTEQGFRALVAYRGYLYSGNSAYNIYRFGTQTGDGTALTGETDPGVTPPDPSAPKNITVRVEDLYNGKTLMPKTPVKLNGTHLDALKAALTANGKNPDTDLTESYGFISAILGVSGGKTTGWMYAINGEIPVTMLSETQIAEGDSLVLFFIDWCDSFYFTMFDKTTANIKAGESVTLKLTGLNPWDAMGSSGKYDPISGATVYALDASGNRIGTDVITGENGKATLTFPTAGTYTISASKEGKINATELVPPLCTVTVTSSSSSDSDPDNTITVYFTLRGLNSSNNEETWINRKTITNIADGATVSDVIIKALEGTGYTQSGAQNGYIRSVTTPEGLKLSEMHNGMSNSGWLYKVNSQLPTVGMDSYDVKDDDHVLIYFTKDYTKDSDAGSVSGGGSGGGSGNVKKKPVVSSEVNVTTVVKEGIAVVSIDTDIIKGMLKDALDKLEESGNKDSVAEVKLHATGTAKTSTVQVELKADAIKAITNKKNAQFTVENEIAALTFDAETLAGITKGVADGSTVKFAVESVDTSKVDNEIQKIVGDSPVFDFSIIIGDTTIHQFNGTATVFLPFTPAAGTDPKALTVYYLDDNKTPVPMENVRYDAERKGFVFTTTHFSLFYIGTASVEWINPFNDVKDNDWFYDAVKYVNINDIMTGTAADKFSPNTPITRAMLVTVLYRYEGEPAVTSANTFTDVASGKWYTNAVNWAYENGVVTGYGGDLFGTNDNITREQMVTILKNYAQKKGVHVSKTADLSAYTDAGEISSWALDAMKWAKVEGLMQGRSTTTLAPKGTATRAEVATILMNFIENLVK